MWGNPEFHLSTSNANKTDYNIGGRDDKDCWDNATHLNWDNLKQKQPNVTQTQVPHFEVPDWARYPKTKKRYPTKEHSKNKDKEKKKKR